MDKSELLDLFYNRTYEKYVNKMILDDKNYIVPRQQLLNYVQKLIEIPYINFIENIRNRVERIVEVSDVTQFSTFDVCEIEMCKALSWANNPGYQYVDIGRLFPNYVYSKNDVSYRKYGENHVKASAQLGLTFEYYGYWYLSCLGYVYPDLDSETRRHLLARTITRNRLYQQMLLDILEYDINPTKYINILSENTIKRRLKNVRIYLDICLEECRINGINTHNLINSFEENRKQSNYYIPIGINKNLCTYLSAFNYISFSKEDSIDLIKRYRNGDKKPLTYW